VEGLGRCLLPVLRVITTPLRKVEPGATCRQAWRSRRTAPRRRARPRRAWVGLTTPRPPVSSAVGPAG